MLLGFIHRKVTEVCGVFAEAGFGLEDVPSSRGPFLASLKCTEFAVAWSRRSLAQGLWTLGHSAAVV